MNNDWNAEILHPDLCTAKEFIYNPAQWHCSQPCEQKIFSVQGKGGKRAIRVYPPWDQDLNPQAQKTQRWQLEYFLEIAEKNQINQARCQNLYRQPRWSG